MTQLTNASQSGLDEFNPFSESSQLVRVCLHWVSWPWFQQSKGSLGGCSLNEGGEKKTKRHSQLISPWMLCAWQAASQRALKLLAGALCSSGTVSPSKAV